MIAQRLYEGVELGEEGSVGLITYMRTDSTRVAPEAIQEVREYVGKEYGPTYLPETPNTFKEKKDSQGAHEAIRPTSAMRHPDQIKQYLKEDEFKVYKLIWQRFVASQINPAVFDQTTVDIDAKNGNEVFWFRVTGSVLKFDGFLRVYEESKEGKDEEDEELKHKLPALEAGQKLTLKELKPEQHFTEPPPRFNEASLVKELEERGIGRPSTYAAILTTIQERQYVQKIGGKFTPTEIGLVVTDLLVENFRDIFDLQYTARLEEELDEIEEGKEKWQDALADFYKKFQKDLKYAEKHMENIKRMEKPTDEKCETCGAPLVIKWGKHGSFYACSTYDKEDTNTCTFTKENPDQPARPRFRRRAGNDAGRILRKLRPRYGAEARALRPVHGVHGISRLQDHAPSRSGQEGSRHPARRAVPEVRAQHDDPPRTLRRVHHLQRISRVQVREAELHRREVSRVQRRRPGRKARPQGQHVLRLRKLSEVQIHFGAQADCREVSKLRQRISGREESEGRAGDRMSQ